MKPVEPILLQRLIDGESTATEVESLLAAAEQNADHWKEIAIALLEDRAWQSQLECQSKEVLAMIPATVSSIENQTDIASESGRNDLPRPSSLSSSASSKRRVQWGWLSAAAAAVVLATLIGYGVGQNSERGPALVDGTPENQVAADPTFQPSISQSPITPVKHRPDYYLNLPATADSGLQGSVPLYHVESVDAWQPPHRTESYSSQLSAESLRALQRQGFDVRENVEFITGDLENGKVFVVPIRTIQFTPGL